MLKIELGDTRVANWCWNSSALLCGRNFTGVETAEVNTIADGCIEGRRKPKLHFACISYRNPSAMLMDHVLLSEMGKYEL